MGDPIDNPLDIRNPNFVGPDEWIFTTGWSYVNGHARYDGSYTPGSLGQTGLTVHLQKVYNIRVNVLEWSAVSPWANFGPVCLGCTRTGSITHIGMNFFTLTCYEEKLGDSALYIIRNNFAPGDYAILDNFINVSTGSYVGEILGFNIPSPGKSETYPGQQAEYSQILASRNGKTNISILYDT